MLGQTRVSPYRLCAHLMTAFMFITTSMWTAMDISFKNRGPHFFPDHKLVNILKKKSLAIWGFTMLTVMSGTVSRFFCLTPCQFRTFLLNFVPFSPIPADLVRSIKCFLNQPMRR